MYVAYGLPFEYKVWSVDEECGWHDAKVMWHEGTKRQAEEGRDGKKENRKGSVLYVGR